MILFLNPRAENGVHTMKVRTMREALAKADDDADLVVIRPTGGVLFLSRAWIGEDGSVVLHVEA